MTGRPFRSIVIAIEKCKPNANLKCATDQEVDDYFENNPVKFKTGYLKFARNVFADNQKNISAYIDKNYDPEYVPVASSFRDVSTSFLNSAKYKKSGFIMIDEIALDKTNMEFEDRLFQIEAFMDAREAKFLQPRARKKDYPTRTLFRTAEARS